MMVNRSSVHVEPRENGWAVVREGSERATSVHRTQSEAAKEGRDVARRDKTEFFLHAQDGRIREHNSYRERPRPAEETATDQTAGPLDTVTGAVGQLTERASGTVGALGAAARGAAGRPARETAGASRSEEHT